MSRREGKGGKGGQGEGTREGKERGKGRLVIGYEKRRGGGASERGRGRMEGKGGLGSRVVTC